MSSAIVDVTLDVFDRGPFAVLSGGRRRGPWLVVLPALLVFVVTAGFRLLSPPGQWARYSPKTQFFSVEAPGRLLLKRHEYDAAGLGAVEETRWNLQVGAGPASTEYFVLWLRLEAPAREILKFPEALDATLASALGDDAEAKVKFSSAKLGGESARELVAVRKTGRVLTSRAALRGEAIVLVGVNAAPSGATILPTPPKGSILQRLFARRNASATEELTVFEPDPGRFLSSFQWGPPSL